MDGHCMIPRRRLAIRYCSFDLCLLFANLPGRVVAECCGHGTRIDAKFISRDVGNVLLVIAIFGYLFELQCAREGVWKRDSCHYKSCLT